VGANPTQALAFAVFLIAFVLLAVSFATGGNIVAILGFVAALGASVALFLKCKPWEHLEE
jgi:hypothetical protein